MKVERLTYNVKRGRAKDLVALLVITHILDGKLKLSQIAPF